MAVRLVGGAVAGALALMAWGFVYWVLLDAPGAALRAVPDEAGLMAQLREALPASGVYVFPMPPGRDGARAAGSTPETFRTRHRAGPVGMIQFTREGREPLSPRVYLAGFLHGFAACLLAGWLLALAQPALETWLHRWAFVSALGLFAVLAVRGYDPIWWNLPWHHALQMAAYQAVGWVLAGGVLAAIVRPRRASAFHDTDPSRPLWKRALDVD